MTDIARILSEISLFRGLPADQLEELAGIVVRQEIGKGRTLFSDGDEATGFYVIASGRVKVFKLSLEGKEQVLHLFGEGEVFGEVPVFSGGRYPAHAEVMSDSLLFFLPRTAFIGLLKEEVNLALNMLAILSKRLRIFTRLIEDLSLKEVPARLAVYLITTSDRGTGTDRVQLDISKSQLASILGTIPETLSRILGRMTQKGHIEVDGKTITILDRPALENIAEGEKL